MATFGDELLSRADAAWLHAEAATNHFVVTSLALLDEPMNVDHFKEMLAGRISQHPRLHQVVVDPAMPFMPQRWADAPNFDLDAHIHVAALPAPGGRRELEDFISDLVGQPLDFGRPLWEIHLVAGPGSGGALVTRFHHSLGDGQAMVRMLLALTDATADGWKTGIQRKKRIRRAPRGAGESSGDTASRLLQQLRDLPTLARQGARAAGALAKLTLLDADQATPLRGPLSLLKRVTWADPVSLELVKQTAKASGTTVNDVVVSAISGSLGDYLRQLGLDTKGLRIRAMVPVNLRPADDSGMTGNRFSLIYLELPVGVSHPWERLMRVKIEMDRIKASTEPAVGWLLVQSLGLLPAQLEGLVSGFYADKASLVLTNVMGPGQRIYSAGSAIRQMAFWEPESGGLGVGISIFSYGGELTVGVVADKNLVPNPEVITTGFLKAFVELTEAAGTSPKAARAPRSRASHRAA